MTTTGTYRGRAVLVHGDRYGGLVSVTYVDTGTTTWVPARLVIVTR